MPSASDRSWTGSMPEVYERFLVPALFRPYAKDLVTRVAGADVLEVAAGTGAVTRELVAALPDSAITATDLNPPMVAAGARNAPGASWQQADVQALPFDDASFDTAVCQFGVMFFPDRVGAFREVRRVLRPGGRFVFSTWDGIETNDFAAALVAALAATFPEPPAFVTAVPHGYGDTAVVRSDLESAGLRVVACDTLELESRAESADDIAAGFCGGTPLRGFIESHGDLAQTSATIAGHLAASLGSGPVRGRTTAHVVVAEAPS